MAKVGGELASLPHPVSVATEKREAKPSKEIALFQAESLLKLNASIQSLH